MGRIFLGAFALVAMHATIASGQAAEPVITPVRWPAPVYSSIARSARITGDVEVAVDVRPDGSVAAARALKGPPILDRAAEDAARLVTFQCRDCVDPVTRYSLYVSFRLGDAPAAGSPLVVSPTQGWVTVTAPVPFASGGGPGPSRRARSARCLWLWRCGAYFPSL